MTGPSRSVPAWIIESRRELLRTRVFSLSEHTARSPADPSRRGEFVVLDAPGWVNVIAITPDERVVLIEQYRHGIDAVTLEIPGGIMDPGETPEHTCARELLEETGYAGGAVERIGTVSANPAILTNWVYTGLVRDATPVRAQELDEREEIGVRLVPLREIPSLIRRGDIHHSLVVAAFHHFSLRSSSS